MGAPQFISNPLGWGGYTTADGNRGHVQTRVYINVSSAAPIARGAAVALSSASSQGKGVVTSTVGGDARIIGIALTSASTGQSTLLSSNALSSQKVIVAVAGGPVEALLSTAVVNGDRVLNSSSTVAGGIAGILGPFTFSTAAGVTQLLVGIAHTSGSTVNEAGTTQIARGLVTLFPTLVAPSSLSTAFA